MLQRVKTECQGDEFHRTKNEWEIIVDPQNKAKPANDDANDDAHDAPKIEVKHVRQTKSLPELFAQDAPKIDSDNVSAPLPQKPEEQSETCGCGFFGLFASI